MVMKVDKINHIFFKAGVNSTVSSVDNNSRPQINEISPVTPDFCIKMPQKYTKIGVDCLENGTEIHSYKLSNGYKVTIVPMEGSPAVVKSYVNVGSMNETPNIKGISHFLEHMAFNGTNGENGHIKLNTGDSFKKIDELGGWANASTNYAITDYVNSAPLLEDKDLETQIKVIASMAEDLELSEDMILKEKGPVSSEINMIMDDAQTIAMDQTVRTLFNIKNPADELVGGSVEHIKNLTREDVVNYYNKYYTPDNMNIVITGDVNPDDAIELVSKNFVSKKTSQGKKYEEKLVPIDKNVRKDFISDKTTEAQIVLGFCGPKNNDAKDKVLFDIVCAYLNSHESGLEKNLKQYNAYPYISSEKISTNPKSPRLAYMALSTSDQNCEQVLGTIFRTISNIKPITEETAERLKRRIINGNDNTLEHSSELNNYIGTSILDGTPDYVTKYEKILKSLTAEEINEAINRFFDINKTAITVVHPEKTNEVTFKGKYSQNKLSGNIAFRGHRVPLDKSKVDVQTLDNNYEVGLMDSKSKRITTDIDLLAIEPYHKKAGVTLVLNHILDMGFGNLDEDGFNNLKDKNNMSLFASSGSTGLSIHYSGDENNYKLALSKIQDVLYRPRITEKNIEEAKKYIRDSFARRQDTSWSVYTDDFAKDCIYQYTDDEVLKSLDSITVDDVKECHKYLLENSRGIVTANLPIGIKEEFRKDLVSSISKLNKVKPNNVNILQMYNENPQVKVLTKDNNNSQADIAEIFRFEVNDSIHDMVTGRLMNSILSSSSIGLFDILREKQNLAYSVYSDINRTGNLGEISLNILTTTDNKEIGEINYDNVQKSINGFNNQINELITGKFTDSDLENAKRSMKAGLLINEGTSEKLSVLHSGMNSRHGIDYNNKLFDEIDKITKEDIMNFASRVFANKPVYSIVASKDTLDANKDFFAELEKQV